VEHRNHTESSKFVENRSLSLAGAAFHSEQIFAGGLGVAQMRPLLIPALAKGNRDSPPRASLIG
jgi:hypothetical protein